MSDNLNPHLAWTDAPAQTGSFVLICHDPDVPSRGDDVNQDGRSVPASLPRVDFFHWTLLDSPAGATEIAEGSRSQGVTPRGKSGPAAPDGLRHGLNDYTGWFAADTEMVGAYFGYDGPCPPWNDERLHHYVFTHRPNPKSGGSSIAGVPSMRVVLGAHPISPSDRHTRFLPPALAA